MAVEAAKWRGALTGLGFDTYTVAGHGAVDHLLPGLAIGAAEPPTTGELAGALARADLVVVENLCSLPLNPGAAAAVAASLAGRPAVLHHHDLPWQRPAYVHHPPPPTDPRWRHVTINRLSQAPAGQPRAERHHRLQRLRHRGGPEPVRPTPATVPVTAAAGGCPPPAGHRPGPHPGPPADPSPAPQERGRGLELATRLGAHLLAAGTGRGRLRRPTRRPGGFGPMPGAAGFAGEGWSGTGRSGLRRLRRGGPPLHLGGVRKSDHRVGGPPPAPGHRALPGRRRSWPPSGSTGSAWTRPTGWPGGWRHRISACSTGT